MDSWHRYLPDYQFILWNEENFDVNICQFTKQAFENKKWAFVSDYVRVYALYNYGGWYLDTDIEVVRPLSDFEDKRMVLGTDHDGALTALMASEKGHSFWQKILGVYQNMSFIREDGSFDFTVNNVHLQDALTEYGFQCQNVYQELSEGIYVYPDDYFHVANVELGTVNITKNSYAIHWHTLLWTSKASHLNRFLRLHILKPLLGTDKFLDVYQKLVSPLKKIKKN